MPPEKGKQLVLKVAEGWAGVHCVTSGNMLRHVAYGEQDIKQMSTSPEGPKSARRSPICSFLSTYVELLHDFGS